MGLAFRFDEASHAYYVGGQRYPSITQLLERAGLVDSTFYTPESAHRGHVVHKLWADYDLGALSLPDYRGEYRGWLLGWAHAMKLIHASWEQVEEGAVHPLHRFAGKPDRVGKAFNERCVTEGKSGAIEKSHPIQTALQAILKSDDLNLPPMAVSRFAVYVDVKGKVKVEQHKDRRDFDEAFRILRKYAA